MSLIFPVFKEAYQSAKAWGIVSIFLCLILVLLFPSGYMELDALAVWILSCLVIIYISRKTSARLTDRQRQFCVIIGCLMCLVSFASIPFGITHPPFTIGEFILLLSGIGVIFFAVLGFQTLVFPISIPFIAVIGFGMYEIFLRNQDWLTAPLIPFIVSLTVAILDIFGIHSVANGNLITFISQTGDPIYLSIVSDCTGIMSMGTFTIAVLIVLVNFPKSITKKGLLLIGIGYFGTFCSNVLRIIAISLCGYFFGPTGIIENVHVHIGWVIFSLWMIIFWYYYFSRQIGINFFPKK
jgi:exosortase/archaeosortase family protein